MRPVLGLTLIAVSVFMLLGFFKADLGGSALETVLALLVAVGIPGVAGGTLLVQHFGGRKRLEARREQLRRQTLEAELLRLAGDHDGRLTVVEIVRELAITHQEADDLVRSLVVRGFADVEVTESGLLVYTFPDVQQLEGKSTSRGVLDA